MCVGRPRASEAPLGLVLAIMGGGHYGWRLPVTTSGETGPLSLHIYYISGLSLSIYIFILS